MANSYYLYQKYQSIGGGTPTPVYPTEYSIDGDGTKQRVLKMQNDPNCGVIPTEPIYRWVNLPISEGYICDGCGQEPPSPSYETRYFTIESREDNNEIKLKASAMTSTVSASTDNGQTWSAFTSHSGNEVLIATINTGQKVLFKGLNERYHPNNSVSTTDGCKIIPSKLFDVYGNIMSLVNGDNFVYATSVASYAFVLFLSGSKVVNAENLVLPDITLGEACCYGMFNGCASLTTAPELPAETLGRMCYQQMFYHCTNLVKAPSTLPATTLVYSCYATMFDGCTSLATAPVLPATTLADTCYGCMFQNCSSLNYIKCLATDISAYDCLVSWVSGVAANGTFVKNQNMSSWTRGTRGIPSGWTVQDA